MLERLPGATLTMAGQDKGLLAETRRRAEAKGLDVRFPGFLDAEGKRREFANAQRLIERRTLERRQLLLRNRARRRCARRVGRSDFTVERVSRCYRSERQ